MEAKKKSSVDADEYTPPPAGPGQLVQWWSSYDEFLAGQPGAAAIITERVGRCVGLSLLAPMAQGLLPRERVRHSADPICKYRDDRTQDGLWEYSEYDRKLRELLLTYDRRLQVLEGKK